MTKSRAALDDLLDAFERHYLVACEEDSTSDELLKAEDELLNAFFVYDDLLYIEHGVEIPIDLLADLFEDLDEEDHIDKSEFHEDFDDDDDFYIDSEGDDQA